MVANILTNVIKKKKSKHDKINVEGED